MQKLYFTFYLLAIFSFKSTACETPSQPIIENKLQCIKADNETSELKSHIRAIQDSMSSLKTENKRLHQEILEMQARHSTYDSDIARLNGHPQNAWYSVLLTAVAVIVTVLAAIIAIVAIFGAKGVKEAAISAAISAAKTAAENKAKIVAEGLAADVAEGVAADVAASSSIEHVKKALPTIAKEFFEGEKFYKLVVSTVEQVAYRGISMDMQEDESKEESENGGGHV